MSIERRSAGVVRKNVRLRVQCRSHSGVREDGWISDISETGCCLTAGGMFVRVGMAVVIKPVGLDSIAGVVRWIDGIRAGVLFDEPLYGPVVDHLGRLHGIEQT